MGPPTTGAGLGRLAMPAVSAFIPVRTSAHMEKEALLSRMMRAWPLRFDFCATMAHRESTITISWALTSGWKGSRGQCWQQSARFEIDGTTFGAGTLPLTGHFSPTVA